MPRKTFTELLPVTFTMEASAHSSLAAAHLEANKSGIDVPKATKVTAVTMSGIPSTQPNNSAKSEMQVVRTAMPRRDAKKQAQPPARLVGGIMPIVTFHGSANTCMAQSAAPASRCSSRLPLTKMVLAIWSLQSDQAKRRPSGLQTRWSSRVAPPASPPCRPMVTVSIASSSPPSSSGSKAAPPSTSCKTTRNSRSTGRRAFPGIVTESVVSVSPSAKSTTPSASSKS
mmetsp:Transcript_54148/g.156397  ORF Transcript_54148/g.156397 Transcript_54148/m.156397 type:complete len:228 (-) Transcript_54148:914-1597(-)